MSDNCIPTFSSFRFIYLHLSFVINEQTKYSYRLQASFPIPVDFASTEVHVRRRIKAPFFLYNGYNLGRNYPTVQDN